MIDISGENVVLVGALLLFVAVMAGKVAYRFGAPALLLFLGVGMLFGLNFISFRSVEMTQFVGMIALCIILFTGGMDTSFQEIKPIIGPGVVLATVGVVMTAMVLAGFVWLVAPWLDLEISFALALLLAATMSSTDSASVFSILRSKKQGLKQHLRPLLELESGSNDPMAYMLTILLIGVVTNSQGGGGLGMSALYFVVQLVVGTLSGYLIGRLAVWTINKINLANHSLYSVLLLAFSTVPGPRADGPHPAKRQSGVLKNRAALPLVFVFGFYFIAEHGVMNWLVAYATSGLGMEQAKASNYLAVFFGGVMLGRLVLSPLVDRLGILKSMGVFGSLSAVLYIAGVVGGAAAETNRIAKAAPALAPEETPMMSGDASGFRKTVW